MGLLLIILKKYRCSDKNFCGTNRKKYEIYKVGIHEWILIAR